MLIVDRKNLKKTSKQQYQLEFKDDVFKLCEKVTNLYQESKLQIKFVNVTAYGLLR
jgi:hypothetical protein